MIAGIGFRNGATAEALLDALTRAGAADLRDLALPAAKAGHPAVRELAARGYRIIEIAPDRIAAVPTVTESAASRAAYCTGSVAEACALAAAGAGGRLAAARSVSADGMATAALALKGSP